MRRPFTLYEMATQHAASQKWHGSGDGGGSRKRKRREYSRSSSRERVSSEVNVKSKKKKKHKEKEREKSKEEKKESGRLKVRSISELAELVKSGQVQVPRSLVHYQQDKVQLLDQIFTILSPKDVKGMLPDILKDLKMKQVKDLCYQQLKVLSDEQITQAIGNSGASSSADISSHLNDLIMVESKGDDAVEGGRGKPEQESSKVASGEDEIVINISDVSEGSEVSDNETRGNKSAPPPPPKSGSSRSEESGTPSLNTTTKHKPVAESDKQAIEGDPDKRQGAPDKRDKRQADPDKRDRRQNDLCDRNPLPDKVGTDPVVDSKGSEAGVGGDQFLEMNLRRRALEAELRRTNADRFPGGRSSGQGQGRATSEASAEEAKDGDRSFEEMENDDMITIHPECRDSEGGGQEEGSGDREEEEGRDGTVKVGGFLEERLRERALQAMLSRKGQTTLKRHSTS